MSDQHGVHLCQDDMPELVHDLGGHVNSIRQQEAVPSISNDIPAEFHSSRVFVCCDGIMYCTNETEPGVQHPGRNRLIWKQVRVGFVYLLDDREHWHKRVIWKQEDPASFAAWFYRLACRCGYREAAEKSSPHTEANGARQFTSNTLVTQSVFWTGTTPADTSGTASKR